MSQEKDQAWLKGQLIELLLSAKGAEAPDHTACAKYADLLYKMLPSKPKADDDDNLAVAAKVREALMQEEKLAALRQGEGQNATDPTSDDGGPTAR